MELTERSKAAKRGWVTRRRYAELRRKYGPSMSPVVAVWRKAQMEAFADATPSGWTISQNTCSALICLPRR